MRSKTRLLISVIIFVALASFVFGSFENIEAKILSDDVVSYNSAFLLKGGDVGILLIHGFSASPWEVRDLGEHLHSLGYTVYGVRVAGHATSVEDFGQTTYTEWYSSVEEAYLELSESVSDVYVGGVSNGGLLALELAKNHIDVSGVIVYAPIIRFKDKKTVLVPVLKNFVDTVTPKIKAGEESYYYPKRPLTAINEMIKGIDDYSNNLENVGQPILIMQTLEDPTVEPISSQIVFDSVSSSVKKLVFLEGNGHVLTTGVHKEEVFLETAEFISSIEDRQFEVYVEPSLISDKTVFTYVVLAGIIIGCYLITLRKRVIT